MTHALFRSVARAPSSTVLLVTTCQRSFSDFRSRNPATACCRRRIGFAFTARCRRRIGFAYPQPKGGE